MASIPLLPCRTCLQSAPRTARRRTGPPWLLALALAGSGALGGCAVVTVTTTAAGVAASGIGLVVDAAVGTVRLTGKAVGAVADSVLSAGEP